MPPLDLIVAGSILCVLAALAFKRRGRVSLKVVRRFEFEVVPVEADQRGTCSRYRAGMDPQLTALLDRLKEDLTAWLAQPSPTSKKLAEMREQAESLKAALGARPVADLLKPLEKADIEARRARQREAAEAVTAALKPLGVALEAKEPPKRAPRRPAGGSKPAGPKTGSKPGGGGGSSGGQAGGSSGGQ